MQWPADRRMVQGFRQSDSITGNVKLDSHRLPIFLGRCAPESLLPAPLRLLQPPALSGLHPSVPLFDMLIVDRLQSSKMASSWFSSTRKSYGGRRVFVGYRTVSCARAVSGYHLSLHRQVLAVHPSDLQTTSVAPANGLRSHDARAALSPPPAEALTFLHPIAWHRALPAPDRLRAVRLQALKIACSWLSSTRKSCGGL